MMRLKLLVGVLLLALVVPALSAQMANTVIFNGVGFTFDAGLADGVLVQSVAGDAPDAQVPGGPNPMSTLFTLQNYASQGGEAVVSVFNTADFAGYADIQAQFAQLQELLNPRADLSSYTQADASGAAPTLPYLPSIAGSQMIRAQPQYIDTGSVSGIRYLTIHTLDVAPFTSSSVSYTFQGISADGTRYIAAQFPLLSTMLPADGSMDAQELDAFTAEFQQYLTDTTQQLNTATADAFQPSLTTLDALIQSIQITGSMPNIATTPQVQQPVPQPTEVPAVGVGPLGDETWTLVSYGNPEDPQEVLEVAPITATFTTEGVSGNASCNNYSGTFQFAEDAIAFSPIISTRMACEAPVMDQEAAYLNALGTASNFTVEGNTLTITYEGGILTFVRAAESTF